MERTLIRVHASHSVCTPRSEVCTDQVIGTPPGALAPHQLQYADAAGVAVSSAPATARTLLRHAR